MAVHLGCVGQVQGAAVTHDLIIDERDILLMISIGLGNKTIARRMDISVRTVENHRASLRRKLGTGSVRWLEAMVGVILSCNSMRIAELLKVDMQTVDTQLAAMRRMMN